MGLIGGAFSAIAESHATLAVAGLAFLIAAGITVSVVLVSLFAPRGTKYYFPLLVAAYALPPFVTVIVGRALGVGESLVVFQTAMAVAFPLAVQVEFIFSYSAKRLTTVYSGTPARRFFLVMVPLCTPALLRAISTVIPWLLLATLLSEIANSRLDGLGVRLMTKVSYGWADSAPYILAVALLAVIPYTILQLIAGMFRARRRLKNFRLDSESPREEGRLSALGEALYIVIIFAFLWGGLQRIAEILIPGLSRFLAVMADIGPGLAGAVLETAVSVVLAAAVGSILGLAAAILTRENKLGRLVTQSILLPLQILPLIVFVPLLIYIQYGMESTMWGDVLRPPPGIVGSIPAFSVSFAVASLAAAYVAFELGSTQLSTLPIERGALLESRKSRKGIDLRILSQIHLPWLARSIPATIEISIPRVLLAVLVTENLATHAGLGGYLWDLRGRSRFAESWASLITLLGLLVLLMIISRSIAAVGARRGGAVK